MNSYKAENELNKADTVIDVQDLVKIYNTHQAVKGISFQVKRGSLFAFLGTNGAGKSTTIEILCTLLEKSAGTVKVNGVTLGTSKNNELIRKSIGIVFQESLLDAKLSVKENILHRGRLYGFSKKKLEENWHFVKQALHLEEIEQQRYETLSGGQKRRAEIARAIIHKPDILFLDEPTTGLDPQTRLFVWDTIKQLQKDLNMTIFLTTHYMEEAAMADEIVIMKQGRIIAAGTPHSLKERHASDQLSITFLEESAGQRLLLDKGLPFTVKTGIFTVNISSTMEALPLLKEWEPVISTFEVIQGSMDDVFIRLNEEEVYDEQPMELSRSAQ